MRTTITLSPANAEIIKQEMKRTGQSFKDAVNHLIRRGHDALKCAPPSKKPFKVKARSLGRRPGFNYDNVSDLLDQLDDLEENQGRHD